MRWAKCSLFSARKFVRTVYLRGWLRYPINLPVNIWEVRWNVNTRQGSTVHNKNKTVMGAGGWGLVVFIRWFPTNESPDSIPLSSRKYGSCSDGSPQIHDLTNSMDFYEETRMDICKEIPYYSLGKVFRRQHGLESERMVWKREGSSKLHEWTFHDDLWLGFVLKERTRGGTHDISRWGESFKKILGIHVASAIATNPVSGLYSENRIARSWFTPCIGL